MQILAAIDPGSGVSSDTGFIALDLATGEILYALEIGTERSELRHRLADITGTVQALLTDLANRGNVQCYVESFVMQGKGGETLQRLIGAFMACCPDEVYLEHVQNSTVKKTMAGHGHADKASVAIGTLMFFEKELPNEKTAEYIKALIKNKKFDILDALAIGVTGWKLSGEKRAIKKPSKKRKVSSS